MEPLAFRIARVLGRRPTRIAPLGGGIAELCRVDLPDGSSVVAKLDDAKDGALEIEGWMVRYLASRSDLPVPAVLHAAPGPLIMDHIEAGDPLSPAAEAHAAELLAAPHGIAGPNFGLARDTVIGGLAQPNAPAADWIAFFRDRRLLAMARAALDAGRLPGETMARLERLAGRLDGWLAPPPRPSLIHGDMWAGNVLVKGDGMAGFVDPAIYYADPEIELAFSTVFSTFGEPFFRRYGEIGPVREGFFEVRRDHYDLYSLLVHLRLFGGGYLGPLARILGRFGP